MKITLLNLLLIVSIVSSVMLSSCNKDNNPTPKTPDYSQDKGEFKDTRDGKTYKWVKIGNQIWMAENLAYTGSGIQHITDNDEWDNNTLSNGWCYYDNNDSLGNIYGVLYQWEAAKKACPSGWHLPTDEEWTELKNYIANDGHSGKEGTALKSTTGWNDGGNGTDIYGFFALPGGRRNFDDGTFNYVGNYGYWWCGTESYNNDAYYRYLDYGGDYVGSDYFGKSYGYSVRCVKDSE